MAFAFSLTSCGPPAEELGEVAVEQFEEQIEITASIVAVTDTVPAPETQPNPSVTPSIASAPVSKPTEVTAEPTLTATSGAQTITYTDPQTHISINYPADWELEEREDDVAFFYPDGDVFFHIMDAPFDELEETAEEIFSEYDYIEETRLAIDSPSGYFSVGEMRDGASHARAIIGDQGFGLIILGATSNPEHFEKHLELFQMMLSTLEIPGEPKAILTQADADEPTEMKETAEYDGTGMIDIVNISNVDTAELQEWASFADSKMASRHANILAVLWPVGDFVREGGFDHPFNQHEVLITEEEVDFLLDEIDIWLSDQTCMKDDPQLQRDELEIYSDWMTRGADASTQLDLCPGTRLVMMGLTPNHQNQTAWGRRDLQVFFVHELYHAFQQDLADEWCRQQTDSRPRRDSNSPWIIEGGAAYFAEFVVSEINGESTPKSNVLRNAFNAFREEGTDIAQGAIDKTGAAALQLMVEQGYIDQADILDGSLFHDCAREKEYGNDNPYVVAAKDSWHFIEEQNGLYLFSEAAGIGGQSAHLDDATTTNTQAADPVDTESSVTTTASTPNLNVLSEHPQISCLNDVFGIFIDVFGVYVVAPSSAPLELVIHTANVLAEYIDNDEDGIPDDQAVLNQLIDGKFVAPVWTISIRDAFWPSVQGTYCEDNIRTAASMYYDEDEWAIGGIQSAGTWDVNLEEMWHIVTVGWTLAYPDYFSAYESSASLISQAMDMARGGRFLSVPDQYPDIAWYTNPEGAYPNQVIEYIYWIMMANFGALDPSLTDWCERSYEEWHVCTRAQLAQVDPLAHSLLNDHGFNLPDRIPDGNYSPKRE